MRATITSKGQITIPLAIRRKLGLHTGTVLEFDEGADHLRAAKCDASEEMEAIIGIGRKELAERTTLEWLDELRGPVQLARQKPSR